MTRPPAAAGTGRGGADLTCRRAFRIAQLGLPRIARGFDRPQRGVRAVGDAPESGREAGRRVDADRGEGRVAVRPGDVDRKGAVGAGAVAAADRTEAGIEGA